MPDDLERFQRPPGGGYAESEKPRFGIATQLDENAILHVKWADGRETTHSLMVVEEFSGEQVLKLTQKPRE